MANPKTLKPVPFKKGYDPRRHIKQKGEMSFKTAFYQAWKEVAEALRLKKEPDRAQIEMLKIGFRKMFEGDFRFWKEFIDRIYGEPKKEIDITSRGRPLPILENIRRNIQKQSNHQETKEEKNA